MAVLPAEIPTGLVTGHYYFVNEDNIDADTDPELTVVTGTVRFIASVKTLRMPSKKAVLVPLTFDGVFDSQGNLTPLNGTGVGMELPATNSPLFTEQDYTWRVEFNLKEAGTTNTVNLDSFDIQVPVGSTQDLSELIPVAATAGVLTLRGPQGDDGPAGTVSDADVAAALDQPITKAALSGTYAPRGQVRRVSLPPLNVATPASNPAPPTLVWSGPGGTPPISGATTQALLFGESPFVPFVANSPLPLQFDAPYKRVFASGNGADYLQAPLTVEFDFYGDDFTFRFVTPAAGLVAANSMRLWVDDLPVSVTEPGTATASNNSHYLRLAWGAIGWHRIKLTQAQWGLREVAAKKIYSFAAPQSPSLKLAIIGDSWIGGGGTVMATSVDGLGATLARVLGFKNPLIAGQGGTGYVATGGGSKSAYGSINRLNQIIAYAPTDVVIFGSINDNTSAAASVGAAASALYANLLTALPDTRVYVVLPQTTNVTDDSSSNHIANTAAVQSAAAAAPNVHAIIDTHGWLTGTGRSGTPTADGNRDILLGSDTVHPTPAGLIYFGSRLAAALGSSVTAV